jgi:hypothetical protein
VPAKGDRFQVHFSNPHNGWLDVSVDTAKETFKAPVSYTPNDFLDELVMAASLLALGCDAMVVAFCEPETYEFRFRHEADTSMGRFEIVAFPNQQRPTGAGVAVLSFRASMEHVVVPFWRALRSLEGRVTATDYRDAMRRTFPSSHLRRLSQLLSK